MKRAALDLKRGERRRRCREEEAVRGLSQVASLFANTLERDEWRVEVEEALTRLSESQREVLVLKIWAALTFPQIAAVLEISPNTAASRYRYALKALRKVLNEEVKP